MRWPGRKPMSCAELVEVITAYLEGTLPSRDRRRFEAHLRLCDGCTNYLEQMKMVIELTGSFTEESIPPATRGELLAAFRDWRASR